MCACCACARVCLCVCVREVDAVCAWPPCIYVVRVGILCMRALCICAACECAMCARCRHVLRACAACAHVLRACACVVCVCLCVCLCRMHAVFQAWLNMCFAMVDRQPRLVCCHVIDSFFCFLAQRQWSGLLYITAYRSHEMAPVTLYHGCCHSLAPTVGASTVAWPMPTTCLYACLYTQLLRCRHRIAAALSARFGLAAACTDAEHSRPP